MIDEETGLLPRSKKKSRNLVVIILPLLSTLFAFIIIYNTFEIELYKINFIYLSVYGFFAILHYVSQFVFALINRQQINQLPILILSKMPSVSLNVAGYREDPDFFRACLNALKNNKYSNIARIIIAIDGDEEKDLIMDTIAGQIFPNCVHIHLPEIFTNNNRHELLKIIDKSKDNNIFCITQPHHGKRAVIRTAIEICNHYNIEYLVNTDSDTVLEPDCVSEMMNVILNDSSVAAVAGALRIFNANESWLAMLSDTRYYYAFNVERAAQSYFSVVQCISGPLGLYRTSEYFAVLESWYNQKFCGRPATSGDDRHLSSQLLATGRHIKFTHKAIAWTETPLTYHRWLLQQNRWSKSFFREIGYSVNSVLPVHHFYATYELSFSLFYPAALLSAIVILLLHHPTFQSIIMIAIATVSFPTIRGLFCVWMMNAELKMILMGFYGPLFISALLPCKMHALCNIFDFSWGTSERAIGFMSDKVSSLLICVVLFNILLGWCIFTSSF